MTNSTTERALLADAAILVAAFVLPPVIAVVLAGIGSGFAPVRHLDIVGNTLLFGAATAAGALLIGGGLAVILGPDVPGRATLERLVVMPLYLTPLLTAMGWNWLASPKSGLLNLLLHAAGLGLRVNAVTPAGAIFVSALATAPLAYLLVSDALRAIDASLTEAARVHGANARVTFRRIVAPLLRPALFASAILVFVQAVGMFSVPAVLGMPAGFTVATTQIYQLLESYPPRTGEATAWGVLLLILTALITLVQSRLLADRSFSTITGKSFRPATARAPLATGRAALGWVYVALATFLPLVALLWAASIAFITVDRHLVRFTAAHFSYVLLSYPKTWEAAANSTILGVLTATAVCALGFAVSWIVSIIIYRMNDYDSIEVRPGNSPMS